MTHQDELILTDEAQEAGGRLSLGEGSAIIAGIKEYWAASELCGRLRSLGYKTGTPQCWMGRFELQVQK